MAICSLGLCQRWQLTQTSATGENREQTFLTSNSCTPIASFKRKSAHIRIITIVLYAKPSDHD